MRAEEVNAGESDEQNCRGRQECVESTAMQAQLIGGGQIVLTKIDQRRLVSIAEREGFWVLELDLLEVGKIEPEQLELKLNIGFILRCERPGNGLSILHRQQIDVICRCDQKHCGRLIG